jgi:hypothetical protein
MKMKMNNILINQNLSEENQKEIVLTLLRMTTQEVVFTKKDGTERILICTLNPDLLPTKPEPVEGEEPKTKAKSSTDSIAVFEVEIQQWRAFNLSNLISMSTCENTLI